MGQWPAPGRRRSRRRSFLVVREFNGNQLRIKYKGRVAGDEMKFTGEVVGMDRTFEMTATRVN